MRRWVAVFQELVRARSVFGEEHRAIGIIESSLTDLGIAAMPVAFDPILTAAIRGAQPPFCDVPGRRNLVASVPGSGGGRSIIVNCHLDTVPEGHLPDWRHPPFSGEVEDGFIYGRGAFDDKAGAIICLAVLDHFANRRVRGDVIAQFVLEDETTGNGSLLCLERGPGADAAIIVDGTRGDRGINEHAGNLKFGVTAFGKPASVSVSHMGVNAAETLARLLLEIREAIFGLNAMNAAPWTQYPSPNQCSVLSLDCEETTLTVPGRASATCYATFTPPHTLATFRDVVTATVLRFAAQHHCERTPELDWRAFATEPVKSKSSELETVIRGAAGTDVPFGPSTGTSDLRHFVERDIPCVLFGPGRGKNPHRADECFDLTSLAETTGIIARAIEVWCA